MNSNDKYNKVGSKKKNVSIGYEDNAKRNYKLITDAIKEYAIEYNSLKNNYLEKVNEDEGLTEDLRNLLEKKFTFDDIFNGITSTLELQLDYLHSIQHRSFINYQYTGIISEYTACMFYTFLNTSYGIKIEQNICEAFEFEYFTGEKPFNKDIDLKRLKSVIHEACNWDTGMLEGGLTIIGSSEDYLEWNLNENDSIDDIEFSKKSEFHSFKKSIKKFVGTLNNTELNNIDTSELESVYKMASEMNTMIYRYLQLKAIDFFNED